MPDAGVGSRLLAAPKQAGRGGAGDAKWGWATLVSLSFVRARNAPKRGHGPPSFRSNKAPKMPRPFLHS